jgi:hypothetical protein
MIEEPDCDPLPRSRDMQQKDRRQRAVFFISRGASHALDVLHPTRLIRNIVLRLHPPPPSAFRRRLLVRFLAGIWSASQNSIAQLPPPILSFFKPKTDRSAFTKRNRDDAASVGDLFSAEPAVRLTHNYLFAQADLFARRRVFRAISRLTTLVARHTSSSLICRRLAVLRVAVTGWQSFPWR